MHGSIFCIVKKFVQTKHGAAKWDAILHSAGHEGLVFLPTETYPDETLLELLTAACELFESNMDILLRSIGQFAAPELIGLAGGMIHPDWRSFELLSNVEHLIHRTISLRSPQTQPANIQAFALQENTMQVVYSSRRRLCPFALGLLEGVGAIFEESLEVREVTCTKKGDAFCTFTIVRDDSNGSSNCSEVVAQPINSAARVLDHTSDIEVDRGSAAGTKTGVKTGSGDTVMDYTMGRSGERIPFSSGSDDSEIVPLPKQMGRYVIEDVIGVGGMGVVYRAIDEVLKRRVAVKTTKSISLSRGICDRFLDEARRLAKISHPNVVRVFDVGQIEVRPYFVMEYLTGETLAKRLRRPNRVPPKLAIRVFRDVLEGVNAVHRIGLVHRDIKPGNVIVNPGCSTCHLLDFGLADESEHAIGDSAVSGTYGYIAPERLKGFPGDYRADFYSLGCVAYDLFTGNQWRGKFASDEQKPARQLEPENADWGETPSAVSDAIIRMLECNPDKRLSDYSVVRDLISETR